MTKRLLCLLLSLSLAGSGRALAQTEAADLAQGIRQVEEGDLAAAIITLDGVVQKLTGVPGRTNELSLAHLYLGMAHLGVSQWERAKVDMREAWRNNKGMKLDPKKFPPRVIQAYEEAKAEAANLPKPAAAATPAPAGSPAADTNAKKSGGGSKTLLIVGGIAAAAGGIALAGGGGSKTSAAPVPVATPRPTPQVITSGGADYSGPGASSFREFSVPSAGTILVTLNWTFTGSSFSVHLGQGTCGGISPTGPFVASSAISTIKPLTLSYATNAAGTFCRLIFYRAGSGAESATTQIVFTPQ